MGDLGDEPRLVVPEGLMIDESARDRLERQLALAPAATVGVGAEISELAPGASYRVHAEWKALEPRPSTTAPAPSVVRGAVLLRPDVEFEVRDGSVEIANGSALVDPGAHVHDPYLAIGTLQDASELGRPPFPRRPVVVFLGCEGGPERDWVRLLVNRLVRRDVEARIAIPVVAEGLHLTRPCLPTEISLRALSPDVVVMLDDAAAERVGEWCAGNRSTVVVAFDPELRDPMELVSWQIGRAQGRLRARIGPHVDVPAFAALVGRLCAGPQPIPPSDEKILLDTRRPVRERWTSPATSGSEPGCVVLTGALDAPAQARVDGLVDNLEAARAPVALARVTGGLPASAQHAALVLLVGVAPTPEIDALIADRRRARLPTVVDLGAGDLERTADALEPRLAGPAVALAVACGQVVSPAGVVHGAARRLGVRTIVVPTLFTRAHGATLLAARAPADPNAPLVIGWHLDRARPEYREAVAEGIASALIDRRNAVELVGDPAAVPSSLAGQDRVTVVPTARIDPAVFGRWAVHVWTPRLVAGEVASDTMRFEEVSYAGVPSVMAAAAAAVVDGFVSPHLLVQSVDRPEEWADALHHVLDDAGRRARRTEEALRRADAVDSPAAAKAVVGRFMGWACYRAEVLDRVTA